MPVTAVSSMFFHEYSCNEIFAFASRAGLQGIEFWAETPDFWLRDCPVDELAAVRKGFPALHGISVHAPVLDLNPCSINPGVAAISVEYSVRSARLAERLGAGILTVHPGRRTAKRPPSMADFDRFDRYITALGAAGKGSLKIGMENMEPVVNSLLCTPERMRELLDREPWLNFTLDVAHALAGNPGDLSGYLDLCGDRLVNVHLSRAEGKQLHLPLGSSPLMKGVIHSLLDIGYDGPLTLEIEDLNFGRPLSRQEKIGILASDRLFIEQILNESR